MTARGTRLRSLTSLRFFAALGVFAYHALYITDVRAQPHLWRVLRTGAFGVDFFFLLSGFVLAWSAGDGPARGYYRRRVARILPNHAAAWVLTVPVLLLTAGRLPLGHAVLSLTLLQAWVPSADWLFSWNGVVWTLSVEAFFYALFPLLRRWLLGADRRQVLALMAGLLALTATVGSGFTGHRVWGDSRISVVDWLTYFAPPSRIPEFVIGMALAMELRAGRLPRVRMRWAALTLGAALVLCGWSPNEHITSVLLVAPFALVIVAAAQGDLRGASPLAARPLVALGTWSYAFYLVHNLVLQGLVGLADRTAVGPVESAVAVAASLVAATALAAVVHRWVEEPAERALRRPRYETEKLSHREAPSSPPAAPVSV